MKTLFLALLALLSIPAFAIDLSQIEKDLAGPGVQGWIHGSVKDRNLFVFVVRNPKDFFDNVILSLTSEKPEVIAKLATFTRHDKVLVKGSFLDNPSPQKHIDVTLVEVVTKFESSYPREEYRYEAKLPEDLLNKTKETFLVHAIGGDGHILVLEYKDQVVPVYVKKLTKATKDLYRNDIIELTYKIQKEPGAPTHLRLDETAPNPVKVIEAIKELHGKPAVVDGELILFPKSPEVVFNVFALAQNAGYGLKRQFTLVNFDSPEEFKKIREKLQAAWDKFPGQYVNGRNKLISTKIRVRAKGTFNEVAANQANAQVLVKSADDLEIYEK